MIHVHPVRWFFYTLNRALQVLDDAPQLTVDLRKVDLSRLSDDQLQRLGDGDELHQSR